MKVEIECLSCIIHRGYLEIAEATKDPSKQFRAATELLRYMAQEFNPNAVAAVLGTMRDRLIMRISGNPDIYAERKHASNKIALKLFSSFEKMIEREDSPEKRFRRASLTAMAANVIEFDIPQHEVNFADLARMIKEAEKDLVVDDIADIYEEVQKAKDILFLADNAGEIVLDKLLIREVKMQTDAKVTVVVKGGPVLNDATLEDAKVANLFDLADRVITTGTNAVGVPPADEQSKEFVEAYKSADFVIAKGMGHAETLTELPLAKPHALLLRTKCNPVAKHFGVPRGKNLAKLLTPRIS